MIYFTLQTGNSFTVGEAVQKSSGGVVPHTDGTVLGVVMMCTEVSEGLYETKIYSAGGGGTDMLLGADWDGSAGRFRFENGRVVPVDSGGDGWLLPELPQAAKQVGDMIKGAIYA